MKKILSLVLALALLLGVAVASAEIVPTHGKTKVSDFEGIPELPAIPEMKTKTNTNTGDVTVTLTAPLAELNAFFQWWIKVPVQFDADGLVGTYNYADQGRQPGVGCWTNCTTTWSDKGTYDASEWDENYSDYYGYQTWASNWTNGGGAGRFAHHYMQHIENGVVHWVHQDYDILNGWSEIGYAYTGKTNEGIDVYYNRFGKLVKAEQYLEGANLFGAAEAPAKCRVTYKRDISNATYNKDGEMIFPEVPVWFISMIESLDAEGNVITCAKFSQNGVCIN